MPVQQSTHSSPLEVILITGSSILLILLIVLFAGKYFGTIIDETFEILWLKKGRQYFYGGVIRILDEFEADDEAANEILLLYTNVVNQFYVLRKQNLTTAWDMLNDFLLRIDSWDDTKLKKIYKVDNPKTNRKRLTKIRNLLKEDFRYPYVEGEQAYLFKALGTAIKSNNQSTASELLDEVANFIMRYQKVQQKREKRSLLWTVIGAITGILGLVMTGISFIKL